MNNTILNSTVDLHSGETLTYFEIYCIEELDIYKSMLIEDMQFSVRTYRRLKHIDCVTAWDLLKCSDKALADISGFGQTCYREVIDKIIELKDDVAKYYVTPKRTKYTRGISCISSDLKVMLEWLLRDEHDDALIATLTADEQVLYDRFVAAINDIGIEICSAAYFTPEKILPIVTALDEYCTEYEVVNSRTTSLHNLFDKVSPELIDAPLYPLVMAFSSADGKQPKLFNCFQSIEYVWQMKSCFYAVSTNIKMYNDLVPFLGFLKNDSKTVLDDIFMNIFKNDNQQQVLECRADGGTLEDAGRILRVTRERVRQIEKKVQDAFDHANSRRRPLWLICAELKGNLIIQDEALLRNADSKAKILWYLMRNSKNEYYSYNKELRVFMLCADVSEATKNTIGALPDNIHIEEVDIILDEISASNNFPIELIRELFYRQFKQVGTLYAKKRMSLADMYDYVLMKFYPHGVKLFDALEIEHFKNNITKTFGDIKFPPSNRAIDARVAAIAVLCDRGSYIHESYVNIPDEMIDKINTYIKDSPRTAISFLELFEIFKDELLLSSSVNNRYFLQGVLKLKLGENYRFTRDYVSKSAETSIDQEVSDFVAQRGEVSKAEIKSAFEGVSEAMIMQIIMRCPEIIGIDNGMYMHDSLLNIEELDYSISEFIGEKTISMPVSSRKLFEDMSGIFSDFLYRNDINTHTKLFGVLKYMFENEYRFSRPYVARKETEDISAIVIIKDYFSTFDIVDINEILEYCTEYHLKYLTVGGLLKNLDDMFLRKDVHSLISISSLDLSDEKLETIKNLLIEDTAVKEYLSATKIDTFIYYPDIGLPWNGWLIVSIAKKFFEDIPILEFQTSSSDVLNTIFLPSACEFENYEEFLKQMIKSEHIRSPFRALIEIKNWLIDEGLINIKLPNFLDGYVYEDEYGKIIVG